MKDLSSAGNDFANWIGVSKTARSEADAAGRQAKGGQKVFSGNLARVQAATDDEKRNAARLKAEVDDLRKRAGKASGLSERESHLKAQIAKFDARSKELGQREATLAGSEARVREREAESAKASRSSAERALEAENAL